MAFDFEEDDLRHLSVEQVQALVRALLLASLTHPEIIPEDVQRFHDAVANLPLALNPHVLDETLEEAKTRYEGLAPGDHVPWIGEIAAQLTDPSFREKTLVAMGRASWDYVHDDDPGVLGSAVAAFQIAPDRLALIKQLLDAEEHAAPAPAA